MKQIILIAIAIALTSPTNASELQWGFKNPSFSGQGWSTHVLSVEQLGFNRRKEIQDEIDAEADRIERELENSTLNKFMRNVESRIYATISKQLVDSMFADCTDSTGVTCSTSGTAEIEGSEIAWSKDTVTGQITLTITADDGSTTTITIPGLGEFNF
tara:strand:- start:987 stop:1460 length:474 start_codon:yes stop_codon:yes gene_type:complete